MIFFLGGGAGKVGSYEGVKLPVETPPYNLPFLGCVVGASSQSPHRTELSIGWYRTPCWAGLVTQCGSLGRGTEVTQ